MAFEAFLKNHCKQLTGCVCFGNPGSSIVTYSFHSYSLSNSEITTVSYLGTQSLPMTTEVMKCFVSSWQEALPEHKHNDAHHSYTTD